MSSTKRSERDWSDWFRVCARCHKPSRSAIAIFCMHCDLKLGEHSLPIHCESETANRYPIRALYNWERSNDSLIRPLVYAMKGGRQWQAFVLLAERLSFHLSEKGLGPGSGLWVLVPPPRRRLAPDHAYRWGEALSGVWKIPLIDALTWEDVSDCEGPTRKTSSQKRKSRRERERRSFIPSAASAAIPPSAGVIFVDDVVTTGATAEAAYIALGRPKLFAVWAIAYRAKLAGNRGF